MYRLFVGALVLALVVVTATTKTAVAREDSKATEAFKELEKEFLTKIRTVAAADRADLLKEYAKKFLEHAEKNAKDPSAFDAYIYILRMTRSSTDADDPGAKAMKALKQGHTKSPKILSNPVTLAVLSNRGADGADYLKKVIEDHPEKKTQAKVAQALIKSLESQNKLAAQVKDNDDAKEQLEKQRGKEYVKDLLDNVEARAKEAKKYQALLKEKFADLVVDLSVGAKAPEVVSQDLEGKKVKLSDLKGKVVVLDIWATWCGPCRAMIPHTRELVKKMDKKPFVFVSISADEKKATVTEFMKKNEMPWTHWWNGSSGGIISDWEVEYFPTIYILDHKGVIRFKDLRGEKMDEAVEKLIKEAEEEKGKKEDKKKEEKKKDEEDK